MPKVLIFASHPIQYQAPLFRLLAKEVDLVVIYGFQSNPKNQSDAGFGVEFEWDIPLFDGYNYEFAELKNKENPNSKERNGLVLLDPDKIIDTHKPNVLIVFGWFPKAMVQMIKAGYQKGLPVWVRGDSNLQMKEPKFKTALKTVYFKWLFKKISGFLYVGELNKNLYEKYGVSSNSLVFAPHSVDTNRFTNEFKQHKKKENEKFTIGFVGKFIEKKNPKELIYAVSVLPNRERLKIVWIGDGPLRREIVKLCKIHKISYQITGFLNQRELVEKGYSNLDLMVLPSKFNETWGLVVNELYCGNIPVITSDKVGCSIDLIAPVSQKLIYASGNPDLLAKSITFAVRNKQYVSSRVSNVSQLYTIEKTLEGFLSAIESSVKTTHF